MKTRLKIRIDVGSLENLAAQLGRMQAHDGRRVLLVASAQHLDVFDEFKSPIPGLAIKAFAIDEQVPDNILNEASLLIMEVEPDNRASLQRIVTTRLSHPDLPVVAAINGANVSLVRTLVREGISDVVSLPFDIEEVSGAILEIAAQREGAIRTQQPLAPLFAVARSIGGCGTTSIATHLAADLARNSTTGRGAVIADLDLQFGSVADFLGVQAKGHFGDLVEAKDRLDEDLLRSITGDAGEGLAVLAAPDRILPLDTIETELFLQIVTLLRQQYDYVVLDLPANWTDWTLSAVSMADVIVLVTELSVASLRQAKRRLELFASVGIGKEAIEIVVNRVEKRLFRTIDLQDVANTLKHDVLGSVSLDAPIVESAQTQGMLVGKIQRRSRFANDIASIGQKLRDKQSGSGSL